MKKHLSLILTTILMFTPNAWSDDVIEVTPTFGYRFGGEFEQEEQSQSMDLKEKNSVGITFAWAHDRKRQGEIVFSHYQSEFENASSLALENNELSVSYLHLGGNLPIASQGIPFWISGGLGITHFAPDDNKLDKETKFSANLGINTRLTISDNTALKIGGRIYGTFLDSESEIFCDSDNCLIYVSSDVWVQSELYLGLTVGF
mgnify:CR=1 FL=1